MQIYKGTAQFELILDSQFIEIINHRTVEVFSIKSARCNHDQYNKMYKYINKRFTMRHPRKILSMLNDKDFQQYLRHNYIIKTNGKFEIISTSSSFGKFISNIDSFIATQAFNQERVCRLTAQK